LSPAGGLPGRRFCCWPSDLAGLRRHPVVGWRLAMADVAVVGAGPVGLWLAAELRLAGAGALVLEQAERRSPHSRGLWIHARTLEILDMRGMADVHVSEGRAVPSGHFALMSARLDMSVLDSRFPFQLALPQVRTEELFAERAAAMGAEIRLGHRVTGVSQDDAGVAVTVEGPGGSYAERARFVVGCDGARSIVRSAAGIGFDGRGTTRTAMLGDVELSEPPAGGTLSVHGPAGSLLVVPLPGGRFRLVAKDVGRLHVPRSSPVTLQELRDSARRIIGTDLGVRDPSWLARVGNAARLAGAYSRGRVFLAGDAAHIHPPQGGQGLNLGVGDAMNLGWKLAAAVAGTAPGWLLDSYQRERRPVGAAVIQASCAQEELASAATPDQFAVKDLIAGILTGYREVNRALADQVSGLAVAYPPEHGSHPAAGRRAPDFPLAGRTGPARLSELLRDGRFALLTRPGTPPPDRAAHASLTRATVQSDPAQWGSAGTALVRPDGYYAWLGDHTQAPAACARWAQKVSPAPPPPHRPR
jgi:2-polyprenyl-6-methoxyphenol hydroxylase-like FAD-dependent oxidoreductase